MLVLTAPWVLPVEGPPLEGGALAISGGRIAAVGTARDLARAWSAAPRLDLDGCALLPALVNGHCHLELTALGPTPPPGGFVPWLLDVIERKRAAPPGVWAEGIREGLRQCREAGQGTVADVLSVPAAAEAYPEDGPEVLVLPEVIASSPERVEAAVARAIGVRPGGRARVAGLSPHAPYTACAEAYRACAREAFARGGLLVTHAGETAAEVAFCRGDDAVLAEQLYASLPVAPPPSPGAHPVDWLDRLGLLGPRTVLIHAVHLAAAQVEKLARRQASVVLCPRSNRRFGSARAPGRAFLEAGVVVGLGTDSRLSAGTLDLWQDVGAAVEDFGWTAQEAILAATGGSARALGLADRGTLVPGRRADILAVRLGPGRDPWERAVAGARSEALWLGGRQALAPARAKAPSPHD